MLKIFRFVLMIVSLICICSQAFAGWTFYKSANARSKDNHIFRIDKTHSSKVRAWFILNRKTPSAFTSKLPLFQVDGNKIHDLQLIKKGRSVNKDKDKWVLWEIYSGKGSLSDELLEFMNGKEVTFQYYLPDGTIKEATFNLEGAREAISEILK